MDPTNDHLIFRINESNIEESDYSEQKLSANFDGNNSDRGANVGNSEVKDVYKFTEKKTTPEVLLNKSCCNITTCGGMAKFLASEKDFTNKIIMFYFLFKKLNAFILVTVRLFRAFPSN